MVARPGEYRANCNGGELSPEMHGRTDVQQFYAGMAEMTNVEPVAQGGFRLLPRTRKMARIRKELVPIATANVINNSGASGAAERTIFQVDFAAVVPVAVVKIEGLVAALADVQEGAFRVQYFSGGVWNDIGSSIRRTSSARNIMRARAPGQPVSATAVRLRYVSGVSTAITVAGLSVYREGAAYTPVRVRPFTFNDQQTYIFVFTVGHADIFRDGVFVGASATGLDEAMVERLDERQRFDAMLVFHEDLQSERIMRDGSDSEWPWDFIPFENMPQVDFGGEYEHVPDEWLIYLRQSGLSHFGGVVIAVTVNGEESEGVEITGADNTARRNNFIAGLQAAIESLPSVGAGGVTVSADGAWSNSAGRVKIAFDGDETEGFVFTIAAQVVSHTAAAATVGHTQIGKRGGEDIASAERGFAACAQFYQDRLVTGGFKAKKSAVLASVTGAYFNLNTEITAATGAILLNLDTDGAEQLLRLTRSKHLLLFTSDAEYYISDRAVSRNSTPNIVECSRNGVAPTVPVVASGGDEGAVYYVSADKNDPERRGIMAYAAKYSDISQSYDSEPMSLLASHLVAGIVDAAIQRATEATAAARYFLPRADGAMAVGVLIRNQEISGFVRWTTAGEVKAGCVDGANAPYLAIERTVNGQPVRFLERMEPGLIFDCVTEFNLDPPASVVTGLGDYEGAEVWARADGYEVGPYQVAAASIDLGFEAEHVEVGRWTPPLARTLPVPRQVAERVVLERPVRVHTVRADVIGTTSIAIGANGEAPEEVTLYRAGAAVDAPAAPYTGPIEVTGLVGWTETGQVVITQLRPGQLQVRNFTIEARV